MVLVIRSLKNINNKTLIIAEARVIIPTKFFLNKMCSQNITNLFVIKFLNP